MVEQRPLNSSSRYIIGMMVLAGVMIVAVAANWMLQLPASEEAVGPAATEETYWDGSESASAATREGTKESQRVSILDILGKLSVAVLCIYGGILGLRWWKDRTELSTGQPEDEDVLKIKEQRRLGQRQTLYLVELGEHTILIADGDGELSLLADMPTEEVYGRSAPQEETRPSLIDFGPPPEQSQRALHGERIRAKSQRDERDWPQRRDMLIRALQYEEQ